MEPLSRIVLDHAASAFDRAVARALMRRSAASKKRSTTESLTHDERMDALARIAAHYEGLDVFPAPPAVEPVLNRVRTSGSVDVLDATWPSEHVSHAQEVAHRFEGCVANQRAAARLFLRRGPARPVAILLHGYRCGQYPLEERVWPIEWLSSRGIDVALAVMPFHAVRSDERAPLFPGSDPRVTIEGFRQAMGDLRALASFLRARGAPAVGAIGMSLGGYATSLLATVDPELAFAVPIIPLASVADMARDGGRFTGNEEQQRLQYEALDQALRPVSPLARQPLVAPERIRIIGARADRVTPLHHARRLATHFGAELEVVGGGHILQWGRGATFRSVGKLLGGLGLLT